MVGTIISTFTVGGLTFYAARLGIIPGVDQENPMEALLFGALISAVDPVATLSIMGNSDLRCDPLLYSLVFGESVLNDAVAISLFRVFGKYYKPSGPNWSESEIPSALWFFFTVSIASVLLGVALGLAASYLYKHTALSDYPHLETSILFCFCYLCYASSEAVGLSGIMALFFQAMVLSHYNSYNLSPTAHVASEQIFSTFATIAETVVFLYMGMDLFTGRFGKYDLLFSVLALGFCVIGRFLNIFPLSWIANLCRSKSPVMDDSSARSGVSHSSTAAGSRRISLPMQCVLWFAGLRGAIAYALAMNMPGPNREVYATATLFICIFTTVVCGGLTEGMLTRFDMKQANNDDVSDNDDDMQLNQLSYSPYAASSEPSLSTRFPFARRTSQSVYKGAKKLWQQLDEDVLKPNFGGPTSVQSSSHPFLDNSRGNYELPASFRQSSRGGDFDEEPHEDGLDTFTDEDLS
jgi:sodium/hydrogen exchanger 8